MKNKKISRTYDDDTWNIWWRDTSQFSQAKEGYDVNNV